MYTREPIAVQIMCWRPLQIGPLCCELASWLAIEDTCILACEILMDVLASTASIRWFFVSSAVSDIWAWDDYFGVVERTGKEVLVGWNMQ